jgi:hypothetical protein
LRGMNEETKTHSCRISDYYFLIRGNTPLQGLFGQIKVIYYNH